MAIDPITAASLAATAGQTISQVEKLLPSEFERKQKERLRELERKEELGLLGLTEQERSALEGRFEGKVRSASELAAAERQRLLAGGGQAITGQALEQAVAGQEVQERELLGIQQAVEEQDLARKVAQEEELRALEAADEQRRKEKVAAIASVASAGLEAGIGAHQMSKIVSPDNINAFSSMYNIQPAEAQSYLQMIQNNPRLAEQISEHMVYMNLLNGEEG